MGVTRTPFHDEGRAATMGRLIAVLNPDTHVFSGPVWVADSDPVGVPRSRTSTPCLRLTVPMSGGPGGQGGHDNSVGPRASTLTGWAAAERRASVFKHVEVLIDRTVEPMAPVEGGKDVATSCARCLASSATAVAPVGYHHVQPWGPVRRSGVRVDRLLGEGRDHNERQANRS